MFALYARYFNKTMGILIFPSERGTIMDPDGSPNLLMAGGSTSGLVAQIVILVLLICINAFFSASETAIISLSDSKLKRDAEEGHKKARILLKLTQAPSSFLSTIQVGVTLSSFLIAAVAATSIADRIAVALAPHIQAPLSVIAVVCTVVVTLLLAFLSIVFGEMAPKRIAMQRPESIAYRSAGILRAVTVLFKPLIWFLSHCANGVVRMFGCDPHAETHRATEEDLRMMVDVGEEKGLIEENTSEMINNIFEFDDITVDEIMTHRTEMEAVEEHDSVSKLLGIAIQKGYSRIPIYREDLDDVLGVCYIKDFLPYVTENLPDDLPLTKVMRKTLFVPESKKCSELFDELRRQKIQMAIVVDEYGGTAGLVTMEDLLESIVGNIQDEYDEDEEEVVQLGDTTFTMDGTTEVDEVSELLGIQLPEGDYDTLGGMLLEELGYVPESGSHPSVEFEGYRFTVQSVGERRIGKIHVEKLPDVQTGQDVSSNKK